VNGVAEKVVLLKTHYPALDLSAVLAVHPKMLLLTSAELDRNAQQVRCSTAGAGLACGGSVRGAWCELVNSIVTGSDCCCPDEQPRCLH
jgi:hypothetical protein